MDKKVTTTRSKPVAVKKTPAVVKPVAKPVAMKVIPAATDNGKFWMTLVGLIVGGIAFVGFIPFVLLYKTMSQSVYFISVIVIGILSIVGIVFSIIAILPYKGGSNTHRWLGLNIIGFVVSFVVFNEIISTFISVIIYLLKK